MALIISRTQKILTNNNATEKVKTEPTVGLEEETDEVGSHHGAHSTSHHRQAESHCSVELNIKQL